MAADDHQEVVEVVGDAAGQLAEGFHLLGLHQLLVGALQLQLGLPPLGDVAGDLGEAQERTPFVADGVDQHAGPEHRTVLAHAPAFGLVLAFVRCAVERLGGDACPAIHVSVELGEMVPDHLVAGVALDALGAGVPVGDHPVGVEHIKRVVRDPVDQQAELPFALQQGLLRRLAFGDVARGLREADQLAGLVVDSLQRPLRPEPAAVLAQQPAFVLHLALGPGGGQCPLRRATAPVLLGVELREMLADDFGSRIALDPLRAGVPAGDEAGRIDQVDGIVCYGVDEQLKPTFIADRSKRFQVSLPRFRNGRSRRATT